MIKFQNYEERERGIPSFLLLLLLFAHFSKLLNRIKKNSLLLFLSVFICMM